MTDLTNIINRKKAELDKLFLEQGLNDLTLKKSQQLDELIVIAQRAMLNKCNNEVI